jgi:hypothetical protein
VETITRGSGLRVGFVLMGGKKHFYVENVWMDDFASWFA